MIKEGQVRITNDEFYDHTTVFVVTCVSGEDVDLIDNNGLVYKGLSGRQLMDDTSTVLAEYPTWIDAVNSMEFKTGKPK